MGPELGVGPAGVSLVDARLKGRHRQSWQVTGERGEPGWTKTVVVLPITPSVFNRLAVCSARTTRKATWLLGH